MNKNLSALENDSELQAQLALLDEFLGTNYEFRRNVLSDSYEVRETGDANAPFRALTREARNTVLSHTKRAGIEVPNICQNVDEYIYSEHTTQYNPVRDWLQGLPRWDGRNHVGTLFGRLPGVTTEQHHLLAIWLRSAVAHWLGMDMLHGNECVVTLIGAQGCGKSTFLASILPPHLRTYYLDHINLGNKNDKEMALTNNLIVNIDEMDQVKQGQQAELKQTLSKVMVNGRPIYGRAQKCRRRFASFVATTNNPRPLSDPTGSRRYLCIRIPDDQLINNDDRIDYDQLYAQVVNELCDMQMRYWFTNDEVKLIERLNTDFQRVLTLEEMLDICFRHPNEGEVVHPLPLKEILSTLSTEFPNIRTTEGVKVQLGRMLKSLKFEHKKTCTGSTYYVVPKQAA